MKMNRQEVELLVSKTLIGEEYDVSHNESVIAKELNKLYPQLSFSYQANSKEQIGYVTYKNHWLIGFSLTKKRGEYRRYLGYVWHIAKVKVFDWFENLEDRFAEIENKIKQDEENKVKEQAIKVENFKKIRALFPNLSWYNFEKMLEGVQSVCYEEIKKEAKPCE